MNQSMTTVELFVQFTIFLAVVIALTYVFGSVLNAAGAWAVRLLTRRNKPLSYRITPGRQRLWKELEGP